MIKHDSSFRSSDNPSKKHSSLTPSNSQQETKKNTPQKIDYQGNKEEKFRNKQPVSTNFDRNEGEQHSQKS